MENGLNLLYQSISVFLFCLAVFFMCALFQQMEKAQVQVKENIYDQHIIYSEKVE